MRYFEALRRGHWILAYYFETDKCNLSVIKVLAHCIAGVSRSVSMVLAYFIKHHGMDYEEAYRLVKSKRKIVSFKSFRSIPMTALSGNLSSLAKRSRLRREINLDREAWVRGKVINPLGSRKAKSLISLKELDLLTTNRNSSSLMKQKWKILPH